MTDEIGTAAKKAVESRKLVPTKVNAQIEDLQNEVKDLRFELNRQRMINQQLWVGETQEDLDFASQVIANMRKKPEGHNEFTFYDKRKQKKDRDAPRHTAFLEIDHNASQEQIGEAWMKQTKTKWKGEGDFPYVFEPVADEAA